MRCHANTHEVLMVLWFFTKVVAPLAKVLRTLPPGGGLTSWMELMVLRR